MASGTCCVTISTFICCIVEAVLAKITRLLILFLSCSLAVIIVCDNTYIRDIMIRACEMNMCNGDYVFMMPGITVAATFDETRMWHNDDERDGAAQHAFRYLLYVRVSHRVVGNRKRYQQSTNTDQK